MRVDLNIKDLIHLQGRLASFLNVKLDHLIYIVIEEMCNYPPWLHTMSKNASVLLPKDTATAEISLDTSTGWEVEFHQT